MLSRLDTGLVSSKNSLACLFFAHQQRAKLNKSKWQNKPTLLTPYVAVKKNRKQNTFIYKQGDTLSLINKPPVSPFPAQPFCNMKGNNAAKINSDYSK